LFVCCRTGDAEGHRAVENNIRRAPAAKTAVQAGRAHISGKKGTATETKRIFVSSVPRKGNFIVFGIPVLLLTSVLPKNGVGLPVPSHPTVFLFAPRNIRYFG